MSEPIGVRHGEVVLVPHDPAWSTIYRAEADRILEACGEWVLAIEHVGSTSIPGIHAKPIIDLAIGVTDLADADKMAPAMRSIGYDYPRDVGIPDQFVFGRGHPMRKFIAHVQVYESDHWNDYLTFRDRLRAHPQLASEYEALKLALAQQFHNDRATYGDHKTEFVAKVLAGPQV